MASNEVSRLLQESGYVLLAPEQLQEQLALDLGELDELRAAWSDLPADAWLRDGGQYRYRRHSCFVQQLRDPSIMQVPHRAHWQPTDYNALHGGMERWFEPIQSHVIALPAWSLLLMTLGEVFAAARPVTQWYIEAHQFRIDTAQGIGRPTPEGAHRDGVDYVAVILVDRQNVRGGETRVFEAQGIAGVRFTMTEPWTTLLLDDERVIHETTPIQPDGVNGVRDTLVLTYRERGFQSPP
ncbi:MAG: 2OG-Fe dioxygenase family protein [Povalibacter sp.]